MIKSNNATSSQNKKKKKNILKTASGSKHLHSKEIWKSLKLCDYKKHIKLSEKEDKNVLVMIRDAVNKRVRELFV